MSIVGPDTGARGRFSNRSFSLLGLVAFLAAYPCWAVDNSARLIFRSKEYGYSVQYPRGWHLNTTLNNLEIENFPSSKAVRGVRLPKGGAGIGLFPLRAIHSSKPAMTLDEWIKRDTRLALVEVSRTVEFTGAHGVLSVKEVTGRCCASIPPFKHYVTWYFEIAGQPFRATLDYWEGDPHAEALKRTLERVVLSLNIN